MARIAWDDLQFILALADEGSLASAARALGVNHTTVLRRVNAFEERLGVRVFERLSTGYLLTPSGAELVEAARRMEDTAVALERRLAGRDRRLSGTVRVTTTDTLMASILPGVLASFGQKHPRIRVELAISNAMFNLGKRAADVAIRPADNPPEALVGRRISAIAFAVYAGTQYLAGRGGKELSAHAWIAPDESLAGTSVARWMLATLPNVEISLKADSLFSLRQAAAANLGLAALPCYLGDTSHDLVRVTAPIDAMSTALWVLTHEDLREVTRVRAFMDFVAAALVRHRPLIEGEMPRNAPTG